MTNDNSPSSSDEDDIWTKLLAEPPLTAASGTLLRPSTGLIQERYLTHSESSTISWVQYDEPKQLLSIVFRTSKSLRYVFYGVPKSVAGTLFEEVVQGRSPGRFFRSKIQGNYSFLKEPMKLEK